MLSFGLLILSVPLHGFRPGCENTVHDRVGLRRPSNIQHRRQLGLHDIQVASSSQINHNEGLLQMEAGT